MGVEGEADTGKLEMGVALDAGDIPTLFGEDQARYLVAASEDGARALEAAAITAGVAITRVGRFGGSSVTLGSATAPLEALSTLYRGAFAAAVEG